ncbi:sulfurtransferase [Pseudohongiella spirulinae]|uniref:Rhodanese-related sulfurtransferase n=1 Tax=Pseudohongiella spirulinae TaxID=1249552 RepID=A0A0S2KC02_9GAMM|nr:rhodanese-like domain-containing protein [Pseudohongiella spirulinae]ALO45857.1 Rhodanese-related sulfurtransferase [Pseudohongiella spirulinae]
MHRFRKQLLAVLLYLFSSGAAAQSWSVLIDPAQLRQLISNEPMLRIIQVTGDYQQGHIPGSVYAAYSRFRGPANNAGQLPEPADLQALIRSLGIDRQTPVIVVHQGSNASDMGAATRVYWTLKSAGISQLAVLNGGLNAWRDAGLSLSTEPVTVANSNFTLQWRDDWRISTAQLAQRLDDPALNLVDARPVDFYFGQQYSASRPGTIRGAENISYNQWFENAALKTANELRNLVQQSGLDSNQQQVAFCNTGHWGSLNWFVMSEIAGLPDTRLYAESVFEWSAQALPMDHQPGRIKHYWSMTRDWIRSLIGG